MVVRILGTVDKLIGEENDLPEQIFNMDETFLFLETDARKVECQCQVPIFV
jgi:hypothetical protein